MWTTSSLHSHLHKLLLGRNKWAVSGSGSAVHAIRTAVPVGFWATTSRTLCTSGAILLGCHLRKSNLGSYKWAVSGSGSTVHAIRTAVPVSFRAATSRTLSLIWSTSSLDSHLHKLLLGRNKRTVSSSGSTVHAIGTAVPVGFWATTSRTLSLIWSTSRLGSHLHKLLLGRNKWAVSGSGSTVHAIRTAVPVGFRATTSRTLSLIWSTSSL